MPPPLWVKGKATTSCSDADLLRRRVRRVMGLAASTTQPNLTMGASEGSCETIWNSTGQPAVVMVTGMLNWSSVPTCQPAERLQAGGGPRSSCWGAKRGSGGCAPIGCAEGRVRSEGLGRSHPEAAVYQCTLCNMCIFIHRLGRRKHKANIQQKRFREYQNIKISFLSLDLSSLTFKNIFSGPLAGGGGRSPHRPPHGYATVTRQLQVSDSAPRSVLSPVGSVRGSVAVSNLCCPPLTYFEYTHAAYFWASCARMTESITT